MTSLILKIRDLIQDNLETQIDEFQYTISKVFTLTQANVSVSSIQVYKNGILVSSSNYTFDATTNKLTFAADYTLVIGDNIEINYSCYLKYSDTELEGFVRAAFTYLAVNKYKTYTNRCGAVFPTPTESENYLIALIAAILIQGDVASYRTPEISITFNNTDSKEKKIRNLIAQFAKTFGNFQYINPKEKNIIDEQTF